MPRLTFVGSLALISAVAFFPARAAASPIVLFNTGSPDGRIATLSRPAGPGLLETETADDFILGQNALISGATFIGLLPTGLPLSIVQNCVIELSLVFPVDSPTLPGGRVVTRTNSPSDNQFAAFDSGLGSLSFSTTL